ncbi:unnamed protein product [Polarella glacialis]|uniref:Uncharacterized protein n=1 Tax=Polarella glacialis TaxID=89957 RepID=A0A813JIZ6_POLGL|nr:unnamed protein product [Polarella glacialis]
MASAAPTLVPVRLRTPSGKTALFYADPSSVAARQLPGVLRAKSDASQELQKLPVKADEAPDGQQDVEETEQAHVQQQHRQQAHQQNQQIQQQIESQMHQQPQQQYLQQMQPPQQSQWPMQPHLQQEVRQQVQAVQSMQHQPVLPIQPPGGMSPWATSTPSELNLGEAVYRQGQLGSVVAVDRSLEPPGYAHALVNLVL